MAKDIRTILVTGGSRGIGQAIAIKFAENNYNIAFTYSQNENQADKTLDILHKYKVEVLPIQANFTEENSINQIFDIYKTKFNSLEVLVNNAGWTQYIKNNNLETLTQELFEKIIQINLSSAFNCIRSAVPFMKSNNNCIVNISSIAGYNGIGSNIAYCAAKAGINSLTKSFSKLLGPEIRVNGIAPGLTETDLTKNAPLKYKKFQNNMTPLGRLANPDDISNVAFALVHDMRFVNGRTIVVDGGSLS